LHIFNFSHVCNVPIRPQYDDAASLWINTIVLVSVAVALVVALIVDKYLIVIPTFVLVERTK